MTEIEFKPNTEVDTFYSLVRSEKIVQFYLFPLVGVDHKSIKGHKNIRNIFVSDNMTEVYISLHRRTLLTEKIKTLETYKYDITVNKETLHVLTPEIHFRNDLKLLQEGRYTEISPEAKKQIAEKSGLAFNAKNGVFRSSSNVLQALYQGSPLRDILAEACGLKAGELTEELLSKIPDTSKLYIRNYLKGSI